MRVYHERQAALLCGRHTVNAVLQGPVYNDAELGEIAGVLDAEERALMGGDGGAGHNVDAQGNFSLGVLERALGVYDLRLERWNSPGMAEVRAAPEALAEAYVCHLREHWYAIRRVAGKWWDLNSLFPAPQAIGDVYLGSQLTQLGLEGWSIFVVTGDVARASSGFANLPITAAFSEGRRWSNEDAQAATREANEAKRRGEARLAYESALEFVDANQGRVVALHPAGTGAAGVAVDPSGSPSSRTAQAREASDLAAAIAASYATARASQPPSDDPNDDDLQAALAASLRS